MGVPNENVGTATGKPGKRGGPHKEKNPNFWEGGLGNKKEKKKKNSPFLDLPGLENLGETLWGSF